MWTLPMAASLLFVLGGSLLAQYRFNSDRDERHQTLIADALNVEAQMRNRIDTERAHLRILAEQLARTPPGTNALAQNAQIQDGLRRLWIGVTWLDARNRIIAQFPEGTATGSSGSGDHSAGLSAHLSADYPATPGADTEFPVANAPTIPRGKVVVRYALPLLLRASVPWWLSRKYEVQLVDASDQVIASVENGSLRPGLSDHDRYRLPIDDNIPGAILELTARERIPRLWTPLLLVLVGGFLLLMLVATTLLRRQVQRISRAEAGWRTEAAWRTAMQDSALVGLRARDAEGCLLYVNRTFCTMVGLPPEKLIGLKPPMPYWPPDTLQEVMHRSQRNLEGHAPREGYEAVWCRPDGERFDVMVFESPLIDADGRQIGWMGSIIDITGRKQLQERERRHAEAMARQARLSTFGEIASALAHQLNQPLTAISSYNAGVIRTLEREGYDNAMVLQALRREAEQTREAGRIVRRIHEFLTRRQPHREPLHIESTIQRVIGLLQAEIHRQRLQVDGSAAADLPRVFADQVLIEQLLINLLRNAMDALAGRSANGHVRVWAQLADQRFVRVTVEDNGPGVGDQPIDRLTEPFFSTKADGLGLGLAICRSVVEAHNGAFDVGRSSLGGALFCFSLPVYRPDRDEGKSDA